MKTQLDLARWAATVVAICATASQAALIDLGDEIKLTGSVSKYQAVNIKYKVGSVWETKKGVAAGVFKLDVYNPYHQPGVDGTIYTFCTDVGVSWSSGRKYEAIQFSDTSANGVRPNWSAITESIENASWLYNTYFVGDNAYLSDPIKAAGMQLAIWKVLYDTSDATGLVNPTSWNDGNFRVTGGIASVAGQGVSWATVLLGYLNTARQNHTFTVYSDTWLHPVYEKSQGMIYNNLTPIPEPATLIAGALLLLPFGASTIRFIRKHRAV